MKNHGRNENILLALLPYWTPQIPPMGISCIKSFLQPHGYKVKTIDLNVEEESRIFYNKYFDALREYISKSKRGNFYNIGHEVLQNHMMAHLNYQDKKKYLDLVKTLIKAIFFIQVQDSLVLRLNSVLDEFYGWLRDYFLQLIEKEKSSILGLSVYKGSLPASVFVFRLTREKYPHILTVMGGAVFSQTLGLGTENFDYFLEKTRDYIDKLIIGEGELLFLKMLQGELPRSQRVFSRKDIQGEMLDLSSAKIPDFSDLNRRFYPNLAAYGSRSCPFQCKFCTETIYWGKYRKKSATQIADELTALYQENKYQLFLMCDSLLNPYITDLAREFINRKSSIYWDGYLKVDKHTCEDGMAELWRRGGVYRARLGVESGSQRLLDQMNKKTTIQEIKTSISTLANAGIKTTTYWIIGYPGETEEDFQLTLDLIDELKDDIYEAECNPFGFYPTGQVSSEEWVKENPIIPLFPPEAKDMLILQTWVIDCKPSKKETYDRINRFVEHCANLKIANPYSLYDISKADERWKKLHKDAVPSLLDFKSNELYIDENKKMKKKYRAQNTAAVIDFGF